MDKEIISKLLSARYLLTLIVGITFAILAINGTIDQQASLLVISNIITFYFTRTDRGNHGNTKP